MARNALPKTLRELVHDSVALLGEVIRREAGQAAFDRIEQLRRRMLSKAPLEPEYERLKRLSRPERMTLARSFTLMLELMNVCENAYRTFRLRAEANRMPVAEQGPEAIIYVLTSHPTEARAPQNIEIFHRIQAELVEALRSGVSAHKSRIFHLLELAWHAPIVREKSPRVADEAQHIYSLLLRDETISALLRAREMGVPLWIRTWVGGDKDGHPGVDEQALLQSLNLSRARILKIIEQRLLRMKADAKLASAQTPDRALRDALSSLHAIASVGPGDGSRVIAVHEAGARLREVYQAVLGSLPPELKETGELLRLFPGLVVPLELRESSDILMEVSARLNRKSSISAIESMLAAVRTVSEGGDAKWYARGFIISMASRFEHVLAAERLMKRQLGALRIPIVPLFEHRSALEFAPRIIAQMLREKRYRDAIRRHWGGALEMMVGYSDSSKQLGVLDSRVLIAEAMRVLEKQFSSPEIRRTGIKPIFFHGSGGSVDRGGGSVQEQLAWWSPSALRVYKATIQGEMIERSFASPEITLRQIGRIIETAGGLLRRRSTFRCESELAEFAREVSGEYARKIASPEFGRVIEKATPYPYLNVLKMGSRPTKRNPKAGFAMTGLRAIPWILCWTQTRVLFPTWWGVGSAWNHATQARRAALKRTFQRNPLFRTYVQALGFTLAKVELPVWELYLRRSGLPREQVAQNTREFRKEYRDAVVFLKAVSGARQLVWFRPWLETSIRLRSPMIHPLNLLQILAFEDHDSALIRVTVTGIASGMLTTG